MDEPELRPAALIRAGDGPGGGVEGFFITKSDNEVVLATVSTVACGSTDDIVKGSGRIVSYPRGEVVAMSSGRTQRVGDGVVRSIRLLEELNASRSGLQSPPRPSMVAPAPPASTPMSSPTTTTPTAPAPPASAPDTTMPPTRPSTGSPPTARGSKRIGAVTPAALPEPAFAMSPDRAPPKAVVTLTAKGGTGFGRQRGTVSVAGRRVRPISWDDERIQFKVPTAVRTGWSPSTVRP